MARCFASSSLSYSVGDDDDDVLRLPVWRAKRQMASSSFSVEHSRLCFVCLLESMLDFQGWRYEGMRLFDTLAANIFASDVLGYKR
jgi:hypothetical protein